MTGVLFIQQWDNINLKFTQPSNCAIMPFLNFSLEGRASHQGKYYLSLVIKDPQSVSATLTIKEFMLIKALKRKNTKTKLLKQNHSKTKIHTEK